MPRFYTNSAAPDNIFLDLVSNYLSTYVMEKLLEAIGQKKSWNDNSEEVCNKNPTEKFYNADILWWEKYLL